MKPYQIVLLLGGSVLDQPSGQLKSTSPGLSLHRLSSTLVGYPSCYGGAGVEEAGVEEGPHV